MKKFCFGIFNVCEATSNLKQIPNPTKHTHTKNNLETETGCLWIHGGYTIFAMYL